MDNNLYSMCETVAEQPVVLERVVLKICTRCHVAKDLEGFNKDNRHRDGLQSRCKECTAKGSKACKEKNKARGFVVIPEIKTCSRCRIERLSSSFSKCKRNKDGLQDCCKECSLVRNRHCLYGVSPEWIRSTLEVQGGACAICKFIPGPGGEKLHLDHKHAKGPRGFLHGNCNRGVGLFKDSVETLQKAIEYLKGPTTEIVYKKSWGRHGAPKPIKDKILTDQGYLCKICSTNLHNKKACVDHDHLTMIIRGILCDGCNCGLGAFDDSVELLTNAIGYLQKYEESGQQQS